MSLRPRYSLLTLLLLTAAVAGGIKLWRGPHRQILVSTNTEDRALLVNLGCNHPLIWEHPSQHLELSYVNQWHYRAYQTLFGTPQDAYCFMLTANDIEPLLFHGDSTVNQFYGPNADLVQSWICRLPSPEVEQQINQLYEGNICGASHHAFAKASTFYVITKRGQLYKTIGWFCEFATKCESIDVSSISDPLIQAWFDAESQSLGMIKK